jgi:hypothetical protein
MSEDQAPPFDYSSNNKPVWRLTAKERIEQRWGCASDGKRVVLRWVKSPPQTTMPPDSGRQQESGENAESLSDLTIHEMIA